MFKKKKLLPKNEEIKQIKKQTCLNWYVRTSLMLFVPPYTGLKIKCISWQGLPIPSCAHELMNDLVKFTMCYGLSRYEQGQLW